MKKYILSICALIITIISFAQSRIIDSLKGELSNVRDTDKVTILLQIGDIYTAAGKYDSALSFYFNALNTAENTKDKIYVVHSLSGIADLYALQNKVETALEFAFKALKIAEEQKNQDEIFSIQSQIAL